MLPTYKKTTTAAFVLLLIIILITTALYLYSARQKPTTNTNLTVATTIFPLADIARNIGGDQINVVQLIPSGASPHTYLLSPQQLVAVQSAKTVFAIGHQLDDQLIQSLVSANNLPVKTVDTGITLQPFTNNPVVKAPVQREDHDEPAPGNPDPHYWLTVPNAEQISHNIAQSLSDIDPAHAATYQANLTAYLSQLDQLESTLQATVSSLPQKNFIAMHNAWSYFARQYGLNLVGTYEPNEGQQPSLAELAALQQVVKQYSLTIFYTEPELQSSGALQVMQKDFGLKIGVLDPLGGIDASDSYIKLMQRNLQAIAAGS